MDKSKFSLNETVINNGKLFVIKRRYIDHNNEFVYDLESSDKKEYAIKECDIQAYDTTEVPVLKAS